MKTQESTSNQATPTVNLEAPAEQGTGKKVGRAINRLLKIIIASILTGGLIAFLSVPLFKLGLQLSTKDKLYGFLMLLSVILGGALGATVIAKRSWGVIVLIGLAGIGTLVLMVLYFP